MIRKWRFVSATQRADRCSSVKRATQSLEPIRRHRHEQAKETREEKVSQCGERDRQDADEEKWSLLLVVFEMSLLLLFL